jgi:hypothetical protein
MFSSRTPRLFAAALMDLAEAMLRPVDVDEANALQLDGPHHASALAPSWLADDEPFAELAALQEPAQHRHHRRRLREPRTRRPGAVPAPAALCTTPVADQSRPALPTPAA